MIWLGVAAVVIVPLIATVLYARYEDKRFISTSEWRRRMRAQNLGTKDTGLRVVGKHK